MSALLELAARCEAATGPDRELDAEIAAAIRFFPKGVGFVWQDKLTPNSPEKGRVECCTKLGTGGPHYAAPSYTASLDAAMTLVPEGWLMADLHERNCVLPNWSWKAELWSPDADANVRGIARNADVPALALCAAALRARATGEQP